MMQNEKNKHLFWIVATYSKQMQGQSWATMVFAVAVCCNGGLCCSAELIEYYHCWLKKKIRLAVLVSLQLDWSVARLKNRRGKLSFSIFFCTFSPTLTLITTLNKLCCVWGVDVSYATIYLNFAVLWKGLFLHAEYAMLLCFCPYKGADFWKRCTQDLFVFVYLQCHVFTFFCDHSSVAYSVTSYQHS